MVDGDLVYEIDAREMPEDWPYGYIPLGASEPADEPGDIASGWTLDTISFALNADLARWAYQQTRAVELPDTESIRTFRRRFEGYPAATRKPFVTVGETLSASTYWHGEKLNQWANDWVRVYAGEEMNFMTSNMEDSGTLTALHRLERTGLVDTSRVMVLRTVSNYTMPPGDRSAAWSTTAPYPDQGLPAIESAWRVAGTVVRELVENWDRYRDREPVPTED